MLEFVLSIVGILALIIIAILFGMGILIYALTKGTQKDGALLITYDAYADKVQVLNSDDFEYKIFDK